MTRDPFDGPGSSIEALDYGSLLGRLLLVTPRGVENISTTFGPKDAVRADLSILDGSRVGETISDALIFPTVLVAQLRDAAKEGRMVLGRLDRGPAKTGQNAPWKLNDPTDADKVVGRAWLAQNAPAPY